ncbi:hypothetical protein BOC37_35730 [Burkholderia pseudomallei]|nr:hypothetical protein BOC37_35730 [Burkholderia pseudomallei]
MGRIYAQMRHAPYIVYVYGIGVMLRKLLILKKKHVFVKFRQIICADAVRHSEPFTLTTTWLLLYPFAVSPT